MKRHKLTKRQLEIMKILWISPNPMIASDIEKCNPTLNINTVQACLRALVKENFIKIADIVYSGTVLTRSYSPVLTKEEYLLDTFEDVFESSSNTLLASLINTRTDPKELDELEKMIARKKAEIKEN